VLAFGVFLIGLSGSVQAHEIRPTIASSTIGKSGELDLRILINLEAHIAGIGPEHSDTSDSDQAPEYDLLRRKNPEALKEAFLPLLPSFLEMIALSFDGERLPLPFEASEIPPVGDPALARNSTLFLSGLVPRGAERMRWQAGSELGNTVIRVVKNGEEKPFYSAYLRPGESTALISLNGVVNQNWRKTFVSYLAVGFAHILPKGLDHILFVIGLFLLSPLLRPLLWQVTSFTLAHTVTLALGIYGLVVIPAAIVEPLIAASIAFIAVENLFTDRLRRWRPLVVFAFGLLHGLGFAGVLAEIGLQQDQFVTSLIAFNLGVELGQIAVLLGCFLVVGLWFRRRSWYRRAIAMPASIAIALVASYWFVERIA
jgi:hypothetical protein